MYYGCCMQVERLFFRKTGVKGEPRERKRDSGNRIGQK